MLRKALTASCATACAALVCFTAAGAIFTNFMLHVPKDVARTPPGAAVVTVVAHDTARLSAWWLRPEASKGNCVMVLHGIGDSRAGSYGFASMFLHEGYSVLLPDSRGHGASEGRFVTYGLLEQYDVVQWADWLGAAGCRKLYALGESMGASTLILAAALPAGLAAIAAECPYADLREIAEYRTTQKLAVLPVLAPFAAKLAVASGIQYARWAHGLELEEASPLRAIKTSAVPILLIHGLKDFETPPAHSEKLAQANARNRLWLVPGALHTGAAGAEPEEFRKRVLAWFAEH